MTGIGHKIYNYIDRFIALDDHSLVKATLFVLHAHLIDAFQLSPFLFVKSAQKGSGKSNLLELIQLLTPNSSGYIQPSPSSIYTLITLKKRKGITPTLCLDEMDRIYGRQKDTDELTGILNASHKRGKTVPRTIMGSDGKRDIEELETFAPIALAGIERGNLYPDTIDSRSIIVDIKKRNPRVPGEKKEEFRLRNYEKDGIALREEIARWAKPRIGLAKTIIPRLPNGIEDRNADNWEQLFIPAIVLDMGQVTAVTEVTAVTPKTRGVWETKAAEAALADLVDHDEDNEPEDGPLLLRHIVKLISEDQNVKYDFVSRTHVPASWLLDQLISLPEAPWSFLKETKKPLSATQMAGMLRLHGVKRPNKQGTVKLDDGKTAKGYDLLLMRDAIERYCPDIDLPPIPPKIPVTPVTKVTGVTQWRPF